MGTASPGPRSRPFTDPNAAARDELFEEVPEAILNPHLYSVALKGKWKHKHEHITLKEGRTVVLAVRRLARAERYRNKRHLMLVDNMALAFALGKGRACNHAMLRVTQKVGALLLAANIPLRARWVASEFNVSDAPSRGADTPGYFEEEKSGFSSDSQENSVPHFDVSLRIGKPKSEGTRSSAHRARDTKEEESEEPTQKGGLTILERKSISGEQEGQYDYYLTNFKAFCKENKLRWPPKSKMDVTLADFFDVLYLQGYGSNTGE
eukprot:s3068_g9.t1